MQMLPGAHAQTSCAPVVTHLQVANLWPVAYAWCWMSHTSHSSCKPAPPSYIAAVASLQQQ